MSVFRNLALLAALVSAPVAFAGGTPDGIIKAQLDSLGLKYQVDDDGDFKIIFDLGEGRSQLGWVRSAASEYGSLKVREIWSPGYRGDGSLFPVAVANRLLEASNDVKLGAWVKQGSVAMFVIKISADASPKQLRDAIEAAFTTADKIERELTGKDDL